MFYLKKSIIFCFAICVVFSPFYKAFAQICTLDWCAPYAVRPDARYVNTTTCEPIWSPDEITSYADALFMGGGELLPNAPNAFLNTNTCWGDRTIQKSGIYNADIEARAQTKGRKVYRIHANRFDIVQQSVMALPGFNADWILRSSRPHQELLDFFANDSSPLCGTAGACRFSYSNGGAYYEGKDTGKRLRDMLDASGGPGTYQEVVYYMARMYGSKVGWATSVVADQRIPEYRAWRVAQAKQILELGNYDLISLNHKFHFYRWTSNWTVPAQNYLGGIGAANVTEYDESDNTPFSAPPLNYTYSDYVQGWNAFAKDLKTAGVPYSVTLDGFPWLRESVYDDPSTSINEAKLIQEAAEQATLVELDYRTGLPAQEQDNLAEQLRAKGIIVIRLSSGCGYGNGTIAACTPTQNFQTTPPEESETTADEPLQDTPSSQTTLSNAVSAPPSKDLPPMLTITSPKEGAILSGTATLSADASDEGGIWFVHFLLDNKTTLIKDGREPYTVEFDTTKYSDGTHILTYTAVDQDTNSYSKTIGITIKNKTDEEEKTTTLSLKETPKETTQTPNMSASKKQSQITTQQTKIKAAPKSKDTIPPKITATGEILENKEVSGGVDIVAHIEDTSTIASVTFKIDKEVRWIDGQAPFTISFDSSSLSSGEHVLTILALDEAGNAESLDLPFIVTIGKDISQNIDINIADSSIDPEQVGEIMNKNISEQIFLPKETFLEFLLNVVKDSYMQFKNILRLKF